MQEPKREGKEKEKRRSILPPMLTPHFARLHNIMCDPIRRNPTPGHMHKRAICHLGHQRTMKNIQQGHINIWPVCTFQRRVRQFRPNTVMHKETGATRLPHPWEQSWLEMHSSALHREPGNVGSNPISALHKLQ